MIVGRLFSYAGDRYEPGSDFDINGIAESRRSSFIRLYGLTERSAPTKKTRKVSATGGKNESVLTAASGRKADEAAAKAVLKDITEEPPEGGVQGEDLNG